MCMKVDCLLEGSAFVLEATKVPVTSYKGRGQQFVQSKASSFADTFILSLRHSLVEISSSKAVLQYWTFLSFPVLNALSWDNALFEVI